jgi:hypothetical protein
MAEAEETSGMDADREWSDAELTELGNMLVRASPSRRSRDFWAGITPRSGIKLRR